MKLVTDKDTHFDIVRSETSISDDGYKIGEPKWLQCSACGQKVLLTEEPSAGIDDFPHRADCDQRFARFESWVRGFLNAQDLPNGADRRSLPGADPSDGDDMFGHDPSLQ